MATKNLRPATTPRRVYFVAVDSRQPNGQRLLNKPVSREVERVSVCRRVFKRLKRRIPDAFMVSVTQFR
jgi:hypothetical protein